MTLIKKIILELDGKEVELTMDQAKALFSALGEMFQSKAAPIFIERNRWYWQPYVAPYQPYTITCGSSASNQMAAKPSLSALYANTNSLTLEDGARIDGVTAIMNENGTLKLSC